MTMQKFETKQQAIEAVKKGELQISCRSKVEAEKVCEWFPNAKNDFGSAGGVTYLALNKHTNDLAFYYKEDLPTIQASKFLALPSEEVKPEPKLLTIAEQVAKCVSGEWIPKVFDKLEAIDNCKVEANSKGALVIGKEYEVIETDLTRFCIKSEFQMKHYFTYQNVAKYFKRPNEFDEQRKMSVMVVCPKCGNKRCPKAVNDIYKCTNSNEPNQVVELEVTKTTPEQREIVGYVSPIDLFNGKVKKGTLYCYSDISKAYGTMNNNNYFFILPSEIVETWQPQYAKTEAEIQTEMWEEVFKKWEAMEITSTELIKQFTIKRKGES